MNIRILSIVVLISSALISCTKEEDKSDCPNHDHTIYVDSIVGSALGQAGTEMTFDLYYKSAGECETIKDFMETDSANQISVNIKTDASAGTPCATKSAQSVTQYKFTSSDIGIFSLRFANKEKSYITKRLVIL